MSHRFSVPTNATGAYGREERPPSPALKRGYVAAAATAMAGESGCAGVGSPAVAPGSKVEEEFMWASSPPRVRSGMWLAGVPRCG